MRKKLEEVGAMEESDRPTKRKIAPTKFIILSPFGILSINTPIGNPRKSSMKILALETQERVFRVSAGLSLSSTIAAIKMPKVDSKPTTHM